MAVHEVNESSRRRIVITGMGVITAPAQQLDKLWQCVRDGKSAATEMTRFPVGNAPSHFAAQINDFDASKFMDAKLARRLELCHRYSVAAARLARDDAKIDFAQIDADRVGIVEGTSVSGNETTARAHEAYLTKGYKAVGPFALANGSGAGSGEIAKELHIRGHAITLSSSSASGNDAIGYAVGMIRNEQLDMMVAGGAEAPIVPGIWGALCLAQVLSRRNDSPQAAMRPFDKTRDGVLLGEGAAYLVLEELSHALDRGARIYAEVLSHGRSCEAYHPVAPHPDGIGYFRAIQKAFRNAGIDADAVDYINAHGTATDANDVIETKAIKRFFGPHAYRLAISSTKPVTGHLLGAAGALETVI
ncbi:MAG TPA: beta-ketoacyl-[acyl-carrier-protein] synthase family protein, partial [Chthoniobacteraceae bacterium]|nr:beta-ketoacyl-[acyl-carrier-protein] synthase family protein [Chthoniobacteraceae bacterium]